MKKHLPIVILIVLVLCGGYFLYKSRKRPDVSTKFIQNVRQIDPDAEENISKKGIVDIKEPGNYAIVSNPKHTYQTFNNCGPATLSMMLSWYGIDVSQKELGDQMRPYQVPNGDNDDKTIFTHEFVDWVKYYGLEAIGRVNGDIDILKEFTANGIPVVVKTWLHVNDDVGHFRIIRGFDEEKKVIIQDDSYEGPNKTIGYFDFLSMWQPFNYDYIVVFTPDMKSKVEAIIGSEIDEKIAWENALKRAEEEKNIDTNNPYPRFNISTSSYHLGDLERSVHEFEDVQANLPRRMLWYQIEPILAYKELKNYDRVFQVTDNILENGNRAFSELYMLRGEIYLSQGDKENAGKQFELAIRYNKNFDKIVKDLEN